MSIFKYFTEESHAHSFIRRGKIILRSLSHFRALEADGVRADGRDGMLAWEPAQGLVITKQDGTVIKVEGGSFTSSVKQDEVFVFCASNRLCANVAEKFTSPFCVEITDPRNIISRLMARAHPSSRLDYANLVAGNVEYRPKAQEPGADWAVPSKLALIKPEEFAWQDEFRIAIGNRETLAPENVALTIRTASAQDDFEPPTQQSIKVELGSFAEFTILHHF